MLHNGSLIIKLLRLTGIASHSCFLSKHHRTYSNFQNFIKRLNIGQFVSKLGNSIDPVAIVATIAQLVTNILSNCFQCQDGDQ